MDWQIQIFNNTLATKATYTNSAPGGIVSSIETNREPSGNCLEATFQGIPANLNIAPRDFCQISFGGTPVYYGYFSETFNQASTQVFTYKLQGLQTLLKTYFLHSFWFKGTPDSNDIVDHRQIVSGLQSYFPSYISGLHNLASTTSGNKWPIVATDTALYDVLDSITKSASDDTYEWGVDAYGKIFVQPVGTSTYDFSSDTTSQVTFQSQNSESLVTSVTFQFGIPSSMSSSDGYKLTKQKTDNYNVGGSWPGAVTNGFDSKALTYTYTDPTLSASYGIANKVVSLPLSDSWVKAIPITDWEARDSAYTATASNTSEMETQSGSTTVADQKAAVSDGNTSTYIRTPGGYAEAGIGGQLVSSTIADFSDIVGIEYDVRATIKVTFYSQTLYYYKYIANNTTGSYAPASDWVQYNLEKGTQFERTTIRFVAPVRALTEFRLDPNTKTDGHTYPDGSLRTLYFGIYLYKDVGGVINSDEVRIYEIRVVVLNTDLLDAYAKSLMVSPSSYPSIVDSPTDRGLLDTATVSTGSGTTTEKVKRITNSVNRSDGYRVKYTLGTDPLYNNSLLDRIIHRDSNATQTAFKASTGTA